MRIRTFFSKVHCIFKEVSGLLIGNIVTGKTQKFKRLYYLPVISLLAL